MEYIAYLHKTKASDFRSELPGFSGMYHRGDIEGTDRSNHHPEQSRRVRRMVVISVTRANPSVEWNPVKIPLHSHPSIGIDGWIRTRCKDGPPLHVDLRDYVQPFGVSY
jgi:hypothetical protein